MRVLLSWLKDYLPTLDASAEEIARRLTSGGIEVDSIETTENGDTVIDLDLTPNRSDCLSMLGVATEIAALFQLPLQSPQSPELSLCIDPRRLHIEAEEFCPYYLALIVDDLRWGSSPDWLKERLIGAGMRPINNIVDLANYVMLEIGEPLHTFDYDMLDEERIVVRLAQEQETIKTLDQQERELNVDTLLICDAVQPIAIAGVMGNAHTEVTENTKRLLVEAACFERRSIRRTSKAQGLRSEAAIRFEKGIDPASLRLALQRYAQLIAELGIGSPQAEIISAGDYQPAAVRSIVLRRQHLHMLSGLSPSDAETEGVLRALGFDLQSNEEGWTVTVPTRRQDLQIEVDLIEEVARLIGFAELEAKLPEGEATLGIYSDEQKALRLIRQTMAQCGLHEILNYSFLDADNKPHTWLRENGQLQPLIPLINPLSSIYGALRSSLLPGMLQTLLYNLSHQNTNLQLFEIGAVFLPHELPLQRQPLEEQRLLVALCGYDILPSWDRKPQELDFYSAKGILEQLAAALHLDFHLKELFEDPVYHPSRAARIMFRDEAVGRIGELHPDLLEYCGIDKRVSVLDLSLDKLIPQVRFLPEIGPIPRYPSSSRDMALLVSIQTPADKVLQLIREQGGTLLEQVRFFDDYRGTQLPAGKKSLAFSLTYRASDRTLTDQEVTQLHQHILSEVEKGLGAVQRE